LTFESEALSVEAEGDTWTVTGEGAGRTGTGSDIGASLLLVRFSPRTGGRPPREALVVASSLDDLGEDGLRQAFERAREHRPSPPAEPAFDGAPEDSSDIPELDEPGLEEPTDAASVSE
jgi:hypothetical protein